MAEITDPQVIKFSNEEARPIADSLYKAYYKTKAFLEDYNSGNIGSKINDAGSSNLIADGSDVDGRTRIVGGDIYNLITAAQAFIDFIEGNAVATLARLDVIAKPHVNGL